MQMGNTELGLKNANKTAPNFISTGVNFTNILLEAFTHIDPKGAKKALKLSVSF